MKTLEQKQRELNKAIIEEIDGIVREFISLGGDADPEEYRNPIAGLEELLLNGEAENSYMLERVKEAKKKIEEFGRMKESLEKENG